MAHLASIIIHRLYGYWSGNQAQLSMLLDAAVDIELNASSYSNLKIKVHDGGNHHNHDHYTNHHGDSVESIQSIQIYSMRNKSSLLSANTSILSSNRSFLTCLLDEIASRIDFVVYFRSLCSGKYGNPSIYSSISSSITSSITSSIYSCLYLLIFYLELIDISINQITEESSSSKLYNQIIEPTLRNFEQSIENKKIPQLLQQIILSLNRIPNFHSSSSLPPQSQLQSSSLSSISIITKKSFLLYCLFPHLKHEILKKNMELIQNDIGVDDKRNENDNNSSDNKSKSSNIGSGSSNNYNNNSKNQTKKTFVNTSTTTYTYDNDCSKKMIMILKMLKTVLSLCFEQDDNDNYRQLNSSASSSMNMNLSDQVALSRNKWIINR